MLKIVMARPVADAPQRDANGLVLSPRAYARSMNFHLVKGDLSDFKKELFGDSLRGVWFHCVQLNGSEVLINSDHVAWIEELDERRQISQVS